MKSKKLLFSTVLSLLGIGTYIVFTSASNASQGVMGSANSGSGCNPCHGSASANTVATLEGIPAGGYVAGTAYPVTLKITNSAKSHAGFDLYFDNGSISGAPSGTMVMGGKELHHTQKFAAASGVTSIAFTWTAPSTTTTTLKIAANAVNNDGQTSGDDWSLKTITLSQAATSIKNLESSKLQLFPNPVVDVVTITAPVEIHKIFAVDMQGRFLALDSKEIGTNSYSITTSNLPIGNYRLIAQGSKESFTIAFQK